MSHFEEEIIALTTAFSDAALEQERPYTRDFARSSDKNKWLELAGRAARKLNITFEHRTQYKTLGWRVVVAAPSKPDKLQHIIVVMQPEIDEWIRVRLQAIVQLHQEGLRDEKMQARNRFNVVGSERPEVLQTDYAQVALEAYGDELDRLNKGPVQGRADVLDLGRK